MFVIIRFLSAIVGVVVAMTFAVQTREPSTYPLYVGIGVLTFAVGGFLIAWSRHRHIGDTWPLLPGLVALVCMAFGLVLAEGMLAHWVIPLVAGGTAFLVLELLFFSLYAPARYPANGLSHVNLMLVPIALWLATYAALGLTIFLSVPRVVPVCIITVVSCIFFFATAHPEVGPAARARWVIIGTWIGAQTGVLITSLPLDLMTSSTFVSLVGAYVLRTRRYEIPPKVPPRQMITEAVTFVLLLFLILATARWT